MQILTAAAISAIACALSVSIIFAFLRFLGVYVIVEEGSCIVYTFFGKVVGVIKEPGLHLAPVGLRGPLIHFFGKRYILDMRLDQEYLRSQPVNSEEGAPMGIGLWYEMYVSDPVSYIFKNSDPRGSLRANVSNVAVRCLSNMKLSEMLENRHAMSQEVRAEVSPQSHEWGYQLGSVYVRKVHFRDTGMIRQIEEKVVNRLRQVTSAIRQDGANQVSVIASSAEKLAAVEFAKAGAIRPQLVGGALATVAQDREVASTLFEVLEVQRLQASQADVVVIPPQSELLSQLMASNLMASHPTKSTTSHSRTG
jgi:regulator of protease activity HflC (stomatin/prohibitin superfamily)